MPVDVEIRHIPVHPLPHPIGQPTHRQYVARPIKHKRIALAKAFAREDFIFDGKQTRVVGQRWKSAKRSKSRRGD
jgi:hypothetical protein